jgi:hypothetical protein
MAAGVVVVEVSHCVAGFDFSGFSVLVFSWSPGGGWILGSEDCYRLAAAV